MLEMEILQFDFMLFPFVGGWISTAISLGSSLLGGASARRKARRRKRRMKREIGKQKTKLRNQIGPVNNYYDNLSQFLESDTEESLDRTLTDFTANALAFNTKSEDAVTKGKGLRSGTVQKEITEGKDAIAEENERKVSDTLVNQERTEMELAEGRRKELQGIDDAIDQLDLQIASM